MAGINEMNKMYGIVALIDVLGVSNYSIAESKEFLNKLKTFNEGLFQHSHLEKEEFAIFGDTIVICWPLNPEDEKDHFYKINWVSAELSSIIH